MHGDITLIPYFTIEIQMYELTEKRECDSDEIYMAMACNIMRCTSMYVVYSFIFHIPRHVKYYVTKKKKPCPILYCISLKIKIIIKN